MIYSILKFLLNPFLGKHSLQWLFEGMYRLGLKGMNIGGGAIAMESGEMQALLSVLAKTSSKENVTVFDVGANKGEYSRLGLKVFEKLGLKGRVHAFEPSLQTFKMLKESLLQDSHVVCVNSALGASEGRATLFSDSEGSGLASLINRDLVHLNTTLGIQEEVKVTSIDAYCNDNGIEGIDYLKIDVEGKELDVLNGAKNMLSQGKIFAIQFEFGGTDIDSRIFFRDFFQLLNPSFEIHRILKDGLSPIKEYSEFHEVFITSNFLAIKRS